MSPAPTSPRRPSRPSSRAVKPIQLLAMLVAFLLVAVLGGVLTAGIVMPAVGAAGAVTSASTNLFEELPTELEVPEASQQSVILAADGSHLATFYYENRIVVPLEDVAQPMRDAVVAVEDRRFYEHNGVDTEGTMRALVENVFGDEVQGGSTLTQQYVKNVLIERGRIEGDSDAIEAATETSISRKLREAKLAISLEQRVDKDDILAGYLNIAQFGPSHYGVEAAANYYYSKSAADLTIAESAMLARITQSPAKWDPVRNPENAKNGRDTVLRTMLRADFITQEEHDEARALPIEDMLDVQTSPRGCAVAGRAAYFCDYVVDEILGNEAFGETQDERRQLLNRGGLIIRTTLDREKQADAVQALGTRVPVDDPSGIKAALSSVEPGTGHILAMAQTTSYGPATEEEPRATEVNLNAGLDHGGGEGFQTGSTFKMFTLIQWLREGHSLYEVVDADKDFYPRESWNISCAPEYADDYEANNLEGFGADEMSVIDATRMSVNLAYVEMANQLDLCDIREVATQMGARTGHGEPLSPNPAMVLGTNTLTPLSMANVVATLSAGGVHCEPVAITQVTTRDGEEIPVPPSECNRVLEPRIAAGVTEGLAAVVGDDPYEDTGYFAQIPGRDVAGKTGTTNMHANAWFVGFTPELAAAVWLGHQEGTLPMRDVTLGDRYYEEIFGGLVPTPIWQSYMSSALEGVPPGSFDQPPQDLVYGDEVPVPDVVGQAQDAAASMLEGAGLRVQVADGTYSAMAAGSVAATSPASGSWLYPGMTVTIVPSQGPEPAPEPEVPAQEVRRPAQDGEPDGEPGETPADDGGETRADDGGSTTSQGDA